MSPPAGNTAGFARLLACLAILLVIWLGVLPRIAQLPPVEAHLRMMRENHVDAGVIFYSELDPRLFPDSESLNQMLEERGATLTKRSRKGE